MEADPTDRRLQWFNPPFSVSPTVEIRDEPRPVRNVVAESPYIWDVMLARWLCGKTRAERKRAARLKRYAMRARWGKSCKPSNCIHLTGGRLYVSRGTEKALYVGRFDGLELQKASDHE